MDTETEPTSDAAMLPVEVAALTSQIVAAFVGQHKLGPAELPAIIASVHTALSSLGHEGPAEPEKPVPMMPIKKTVTNDYLISLEDGRHYKSLKRHLTGRGLTPAEYREKWGLPKDYPMVAPSYAKHRSELAKSLGLGQQRRKARAADETEPKPAAGRRGRPPADATQE